MNHDKLEEIMNNLYIRAIKQNSVPVRFELNQACIDVIKITTRSNFTQIHLFYFVRVLTVDVHDCYHIRLFCKGGKQC